MHLPFDLTTRYYDLLYRDKDYAGEAAYVAATIRRRLPQAQRILELGCGTGGHAEHLARLGFEVHGVDLSAPMLARAQARRSALPAELAARLRYSLGDARSVRVGPPSGQPQGGAQGVFQAGFDAVISLFHVMSYQADNDDLRAAYDTAHAHLCEGGVFLYDYWYGPAVLSQRPEVRVRRLSGEGLDVTRVAEPVMHWARNVCDVNYTVLARDTHEHDQAPLQQLRETHPMRYLFQPELALLEGASWRQPEDRAWLAEAPPDAQSWAAMRVLSRA